MHQVNTIGNLKILNSRETKHIVERITEQYGCSDEFAKAISGYVFLTNKDNRIYIVSRSIELIPYDEMKIDGLGMYFGELYKESMRFTIEGCQFVGKFATKNLVEFTKDQISDWAKGSDIAVEDSQIEGNTFEDNNDFLIVKNTRIVGDNKETDYYGSGKFKDGKIMNFVSKSRKLVTVNE
ncbi:MAG TPA: hypothetical protein VEC16_06325 [Alphaproteobacteria bacterium]|nr:hypothetical protein [Alphaproteobacteria bacterium]